MESRDNPRVSCADVQSFYNATDGEAKNKSERKASQLLELTVSLSSSHLVRDYSTLKK